jgi:Peptidase M15
MAEQPLLALQVKPIQTPTYGDIMQQRDEYRAQQNALAQQQMQQQQNAMLQTIYRRNVDASGNINRQGIAADLARVGMGSNIAGQLENLGKAGEATSKADSAKLSYAQAVTKDFHMALGNSNTREEALANGATLMQKYPELADQIKGELQTIPTDPAGFAQWHEHQLRTTLDAKDQLEQHFAQQNLGGSMREIAMSKYGTGAASVVPGSEAQVTMTPAQANPAGKVVQDENGNYFTVDPRTGTAKPVTMGGGGIPGQRGGGVGIQPGQYGAAIESAAMQLAPGTTVSGRGRTPERNAQVGGVANSYHLTDNARDLQPARGQSLDQLAASLAPLKQQGFDVIIERGKNHVHVEPGPGMGKGNAAPAAGGGQLQGPTKGKPAASSSPAIQDIDTQISRLGELYNHKGLEYITGSVHGRMGPLNALPGFDVKGYRIGGGGQEADNAQALLETIQANATLGELQKLKQSGTTLGQIAVYEDKMLGKAAANLKQTQDKATFQKALREYKDRLLEVKKLLVRASIPETAVKHLRDNPNLKNAFDSKYGAGMAASVLGGR